MRNNPSWIDEPLAKAWAQIEGAVRPAWMPRLGNPLFDPSYRPDGNYRLSFTAEELGCGAYGCVYATHDEQVVFKVTTDDTEVEFARTLAADVDVCVRYLHVMSLNACSPDTDQPMFALWPITVIPHRQHFNVLVQSDPRALGALLELIPTHIAPQALVWIHLEGTNHMSVW